MSGDFKALGLSLIGMVGIVAVYFTLVPGALP